MIRDIRKGYLTLADIRSEYRAGRNDARRTPGAKAWHGRRYGDVFYALGYAREALA